jgi:hypothetical protein
MAVAICWVDLASMHAGGMHTDVSALVPVTFATIPSLLHSDLCAVMDAACCLHRLACNTNSTSGRQSVLL